jgi:osmoprotectant transport system ATP-binding protein
MFNRLEEPTSGEVVIRGRPASSLDPVLLRRQTGYVQQEGGLLPHWTVGRNVELVPSLLDWPRARRTRRADDLLDLVGLDPGTYRARYPCDLSGGQRQRVAFARALAGDPDLVLLDEPFGALDAITRLELHDEFTRMKSRLGKTMLIVTHDLGEAFKLADRVAVMRSGRLLQVGTREELLESPAAPYVSELLEMGMGTRS